MNYSDGSSYEGEWKIDIREGMGNFTYPNQDSYTGLWKMNKENGQGFYRYANTGKSEMRTYLMGNVQPN